MAELKTVMAPLTGSNYATWKIQCRMALMKDGLWGIVSGSEEVPKDVDARRKFQVKSDRALATIVLTVQPSLLYLLGDPVDPTIVWNKLADQFQKKTWVNKLALRRRLYSLKLRNKDPVQQHIKSMTEIFEELSVIGDPIEEEDHVVHLLASLPESFDMLVTALEASAEVPKLETVTGHLLHEERKLKEKSSGNDDDGGYGAKAFIGKQRYNNKGPKCYHCGKVGHIKCHCDELRRNHKNFKDSQNVNFAEKTCEDSSSSDSDYGLVVVSHALSSVTNIEKSK